MRSSSLRLAGVAARSVSIAIGCGMETVCDCLFLASAAASAASGSGLLCSECTRDLGLTEALGARSLRD